MARRGGYGSDDQSDRSAQTEQEEQDDQSRSSQSDSDEGGQTAQERKKAALFPAISSICSALGGFEEFKNAQGEIVSEYSLGDQVVGCLKDLKRFWRMDDKDDDRTVSRIFHEVGVLPNDLIPILLSTLGTGPKGDRIALACVELIGAMTWPINVAQELLDAQLLDTLKKSIDYNSLILAQLSYKAAILRSGALRAMFTLMSPSLMKSRKERLPKDENIISLVLHTFRNLAALRDRATQSDSADAIELSTLQSEYIVQLSAESIFDLLLAIASNAESSEYAPWNMVALDIFHLIFRGVKPPELMVAAGMVDENRLKDLLDLEGKSKRAGAKKGNSRHSRFGTTVALQAGGKQYILHKQSTLSVGAAASLDKIKKGKSKKIRQDDELQPPSHYRADAIACLHDVALTFIDSSFNPFFASILSDIRMERLKVKESDTIRFLFLSRFFLEFFLLVRLDEAKNGPRGVGQTELRGFELIAEVTEVAFIGFVTSRMKKSLEEKPPLWTELHAGIDCFIQILLTIEALSTSGSEDALDISEILQNKLYYEADMLDMVLTVITKFNTQSHKYLDSVINLSYVLLRMLEKYSKSKAYMYVRKKRSRAGKKRNNKSKDAEEEGEGLGKGDDEEEEMDSGALTYGEHAFEFEKFEASFASEAVLQTCMIYLEGYKTFTDPEQMKRIVSLMHRQAIKAKNEGLFYKPSVLELFRRILDDEQLSSSKEGAAVDLRKFIEYVLKKFFKAVKENSLLLVEIFLPKTHHQLSKMRSGQLDPYASSEEEGPGYKFRDAEVEVEPGFSLTQQIGITVAVLVDAGNLHLVELVQGQLALAAAARTSIVLRVDSDLPLLEGEEIDPDEAIRRRAALATGPSEVARSLFEPHEVEFGGKEDRALGTTNGPFKLLLRLLQWESSEDPESGDLGWEIPVALLPSVLSGDIKIITSFLLDPVDPNGKTAADLLRKKRKKVVRRKRRELTPGGGLQDVPSDDQQELRVKKAKKVGVKRVRGHVEVGPDGEERPKKSRAEKRQAEVENFKSAQFIVDSDEEDNPERDALFFASEAALRERLAAGDIHSTQPVGSKKKVPKKATKEKVVKAPAKPKKVKPVKRTNFITADVSDLSAAEEEGEDAVMEASSSPSYSAVASRKREATASADEEEGPETMLLSPVQQVVAKRRRMVIDSDDEE